MAGFVTAYSKTTGKKHRVPAHYLEIEHPAFAFSKAPPRKRKESAAPATQDTENKPGTAGEGGPQ